MHKPTPNDLLFSVYHLYHTVNILYVQTNLLESQMVQVMPSQENLPQHFYNSVSLYHQHLQHVWPIPKSSSHYLFIYC